jgi:hypothetical protein
MYTPGYSAVYFDGPSKGIYWELAYAPINPIPTEYWRWRALKRIGADHVLMPTRFDEQLEAARGDRIRVLVVGAGIAGAVLAQLLRRQGLYPVLLECSPSSLEGGYMFGLMPLINEPLRCLGVWDEYCARSVAMYRYRLCSAASG